MRIGRWLCNRGLHRWVPVTTKASDDPNIEYLRSAGAMAHQERCKRPGCNWWRDPLSGIPYEMEPEEEGNVPSHSDNLLRASRRLL